MTMNVAAYIAAQRALLDRLEQFARTPEYERLLSALQDFASDDPEPWLADWLISPAFGLGRALPIDVAGAPSGVDRLVAQLLRICRHRAGRTIAAQSTSMYCSGSHPCRFVWNLTGAADLCRPRNTCWRVHPGPWRGDHVGSLDAHVEAALLRGSRRCISGRIGFNGMVVQYEPV